MRLAGSSVRLSVTPPVCTEDGDTLTVISVPAVALGLTVRAAAGVANDDITDDGLGIGLVTGVASAGGGGGTGVS